MNCERCLFWEYSGGDGESKHGYCHRCPPVIDPEWHTMPGIEIERPYTDDSLGWVFPIIESYEWCGEFKAKDKS